MEQREKQRDTLVSKVKGLSDMKKRLDSFLGAIEEEIGPSDSPVDLE